MKYKKLLKFTAVAVITAGFAVGCSSDSSEMADTSAEAECLGATPEVKNAIYAAKLKIARAENLGYDMDETGDVVEAAENAAEECDNVRAKILADKAEQEASDAIAQYHASQDSGSLGSYEVVTGDNLWDIAGQGSVYGNSYQWPLIYKGNSDQIEDPDLIFAGQILDIPNASDSEASAAVEHAKTRGAWGVGEMEASDQDYLAQ